MNKGLKRKQGSEVADVTVNVPEASETSSESPPLAEPLLSPTPKCSKLELTKADLDACTDDVVAAQETRITALLTATNLALAKQYPATWLTSEAVPAGVNPNDFLKKQHKCDYFTEFDPDHVKVRFNPDKSYCVVDRRYVGVAEVWTPLMKVKYAQMGAFGNLNKKSDEQKYNVTLDTAKFSITLSTAPFSSRPHMLDSMQMNADGVAFMKWYDQVEQNVLQQLIKTNNTVREMVEQVLKGTTTDPNDMVAVRERLTATKMFRPSLADVDHPSKEVLAKNPALHAYGRASLRITTRVFSRLPPTNKLFFSPQELQLPEVKKLLRICNDMKLNNRYYNYPPMLEADGWTEVPLLSRSVRTGDIVSCLLSIEVYVHNKEWFQIKPGLRKVQGYRTSNSLIPINLVSTDNDNHDTEQVTAITLPGAVPFNQRLTVTDIQLGMQLQQLGADSPAKAVELLLENNTSATNSNLQITDENGELLQPVLVRQRGDDPNKLAGTGKGLYLFDGIDEDCMRELLGENTGKV